MRKYCLFFILFLIYRSGQIIVHGNRNRNIITNNSPFINHTIYTLGDRRNFILKQNKSDFELILYVENSNEISRKITLTMQRWRMLSAIIDTISECFNAICKNKEAGMFYHLGGGIHVKLESPYRVVRIRKYYLSKENQFLSTSADIAMRYDEYRDLKMALNTINTTLKLETIKT